VLLLLQLFEKYDTRRLAINGKCDDNDRGKIVIRFRRHRAVKN